MNRTVKQMSSYAFAALAVTVILSHCGKTDEVKTATQPGVNEMSLNGATYRLVDAAVNHKNDGKSIAAQNAKIQFKDPVGLSAETNVGFEIEFTVEDGGSVTLVSHAKPKLEEGVNLKFIRKGKLLSVEATTPGKSHTVDFKAGEVDASKTIGLAIDVHNKESANHILFWNSSVPKEKRKGRHMAEIDDELSKGKSNVFGLILDKASVSVAKITTINNPH